jgi:hypothetical protein
MDEAPRSRSRHPVVVTQILFGGDAEGTLAGRVQHFQVGERASATELEWDIPVLAGYADLKQAMAAGRSPEPDQERGRVRGGQNISLNQ